MSKLYDVIIIGGGPAGLSAGLYAGRARLATLLVEKDKEGGQIVQTAEIEKDVYKRHVVNSVWETKKTTTIIQNVEGERKALVTGVPIFNEEGCIERIITATRDLKVLIEEVEKNPMQQEIDSLVNRLQRTESLVEKYFAELRQLRKEKTEEKRITSKNKEMRLVLELAKKVAPVDSNVLILGESGTGKDLLANMIHNMSRRCSGPFIKVNCGAIPENILESELFGYEEGAFTGAQKNGKAGLLEIADGGTIFLNEIGEMPYQLQVKLLQAIQAVSYTHLDVYKRQLPGSPPYRTERKPPGSHVWRPSCLPRQPPGRKWWKC